MWRWVYRILVWKPEQRGRLPKRSWRDNVTVDLKKKGRGCLDSSGSGWWPGNEPSIPISVLMCEVVYRIFLCLWLKCICNVRVSFKIYGRQFTLFHVYQWMLNFVVYFVFFDFSIFKERVSLCLLRIRDAFFRLYHTHCVLTQQCSVIIRSIPLSCRLCNQSHRQTNQLWWGQLHLICIHGSTPIWLNSLKSSGNYMYHTFQHWTT
jgi:hypothetical protein